MIVIGLDPGTEQSALVTYDGTSILAHDTLVNKSVLECLGAIHDRWHTVILAIEQIESMGMPVGKETFETVFWSGRFAQAWAPRLWDRVTRRQVKQHLCFSIRATDANIRQALYDRFGPGKTKAVGTKKAPGPLYGLKGHEFAALAVAVTYYDSATSAEASANEVKDHAGF